MGLSFGVKLIFFFVDDVKIVLDLAFAVEVILWFGLLDQFLLGLGGGFSEVVIFFFLESPDFLLGSAFALQVRLRVDRGFLGLIWAFASEELVYAIVFVNIGYLFPVCPCSQSVYIDSLCYFNLKLRI